MTEATAGLNGTALEELLDLGERRLYSVYLDLSVGSNGQRSHEVFLKKKENQFAELIGEDAVERERLGRVLSATRRWLSNSFDEANKGASLFLSEEGEILRAFQIPTPFENLFVFQQGAVLAPLARIVEDHDHHCVVVVDSTRSRILSVYLNAVEREESYANPEPPRRTSGGGYSQARFQRHRAEGIQQFHDDVAKHLDRFVRRYGPDDIILLGTDEATSDFQKALPQGIRERVRFVRPAPADEPASALLERIRGILEEEQVREDEEILARLQRRVRQDYLAVGGVRSTLQELQSGKVETLVVGGSLRREGTQCTRCQFVLADGEAACPYCGGKLASVNLYDKLVELAERHDAKVEFLEGDAASELLREMNGVGAFLKFQYENA